jgi:hypothetical protein
MVSTNFTRGTAGLPLPIGEREGVRGIGSLDILQPLTPPLSLREREPAEIVAWSCVASFPVTWMKMTDADR